ncbi:hypothetical protein MMC06_002644 [Schaereria dolodes]|nr:hypothetical protein [Schaereria dolodes]
MATSTVNGSMNVEGNGSIASTASPTRQQAKSSYASKMPDNNRKLTSNNAGESTQRRNPPQKAWQSGMNPITQRSNTPQPNGAGNLTRSVSQKDGNLQETSTPDRHSDDRLLYILGSFMGHSVLVTTKNGDTYTGIFAGSTMDNHECGYLFKMVQAIDTKSGLNGDRSTVADYIGVGEDHAMSFDAKDVGSLVLAKFALNPREKPQNGSVAGFRTDTDISGNLAVRERNLQRWQPSTDSDVDLSLESSSGAWDQFEANEQRFGLKSDYDENIYTTRIDKSDPLYTMREAEAARIAREIEGGTTTNSHVREERGISQVDDGLDEEERYSGVRRNGEDYPPLRSNQPNKYTPPARRPAPKKIDAAGASLDPAIISSQIARPASKSQERQLQDTTQVTTSATETKSLQPNQIKQALTAEKEIHTKAPLSIVTGKTASSGVSATENVETELLDSFRNFANIEKIRVQDSRRNRASADKAIRLNDLMKFSKNFKLLTPVPKDLVPILAKDKSKQEEIMEKAQRNAEQASSAPPKTLTTTDQKTQRPLAAARYDGASVTLAASERQNFPRAGRTGYPPQGPSVNQPNQRGAPQNGSNQSSRAGQGRQGLFGHRLADNHRLHKAGLPVSVPNPLPIQDARGPPTKPASQIGETPSPQKPSEVRSPTSATSAKFNVRAMEFKPNPAASSFKPTTDPSATSSPVSGAITQSVSRAPSPSMFFGSRKPIAPSERPSILANFNPFTFLKREAENEKKTKDYASNGGIKPAYKTPPTWNPPKDGEEYKSYKDMFDVTQPATHATTPHHASPVNPPLPHQHQLPLHMQNGPQGIPQVQTPQQVQHHLQVQPQHYHTGPHHYDDHHMRPSASSSSMYPSPSPRMQNTHMAYPSPMTQHAQLAYGQPNPHYIVGPQPSHFRQYPAGPHMIPPQGPHLAASLMVQQPSGGGYMGIPQPVAVPFNPQMPMYPGGTPQVYGAPSQPPSGYPSPGRGAPLMVHQGSHPGQHPQMYIHPSHYGQPVYSQQQPVHMTTMRGNYGSPQSHYSQSSHQAHQFTHQPHRTPSNGYGQMAQVHQQQMAVQQTPPSIAPMEMGDDSK